jgi:WD40 repeat protein
VEARDSADPFINSFGVVNQFDSDPDAKPSTKERACYTHRETIFGVTFSECGKYCATASQDSTVCIWDVKTNALLTQLTGHSKSNECLRVAWASEGWASQILDRSSVRDDFAHLLATSGADGVVKMWACPDPLERKNDWECVYTLDHSSLSIHSRTKKKSVKQDDDENETSSVEDGEKIERDDKPQTYALQFIDHWQAFNTGSSDDHAQNSFFMTSSDEFIHFWELETSRPDQTVEILENNKIRMVPDKIDLKEVMSLHFGELDVHGYGVSLCSITGMGLPLPPPPVSSTSPLSSDGVPFGGERNPNNKVFVFDAVYCKANGLLGAALSDGSLRLINGRGICISILNLPGCQSHLTSFCWDSKGTRLATSVATGHLISWNLDLGDVQGQGRSYATCTAIMEGGHQLGRPLFGSRFCGKDENLIVSWCVDGSLCLWDSYSAGNVHAPIAVLRSDPNYPIYAVELSKDTIAVCGGNGDGDFIGIPLYLYTFDGLRGADDEKSENQSPTHESEDDEQSPNKKPKN